MVHVIMFYPLSYVTIVVCNISFKKTPVPQSPIAYTQHIPWIIPFYPPARLHGVFLFAFSKMWDFLCQWEGLQNPYHRHSNIAVLLTRHGTWRLVTCDRGLKGTWPLIFLNPTWDMDINKRQEHATWLYLKFNRDIWDPLPRPSRPLKSMS